MGHPLRWFIPGIVYEITTRTIQERYLLRPAPGVRELIVGVLARGTFIYPAVRIHAFAYLSNHYHLLASADDGLQLARFTGYVNSNVARELGRVHSWKGPFWGRRHRAIPVLDADAEVARLRYVLAQGVKEGLIERPEHWPGATSTEWLLGGQLTGTWIHRDLERRARGRVGPCDPSIYTERYVLELSPLPSWSGLSRDEIARRARGLIEEVVSEAAVARGTRSIAGVEAALNVAAHASPAESRSGRAPMCHASANGLRRAFRGVYNAFTSAFRVAADALKRSGTFVRGAFPAGCFPSPFAYVACELAAAPWLAAPFAADTPESPMVMEAAAGDSRRATARRA